MINPIQELEGAAAASTSLEEAAKVLEHLLTSGYSVTADGQLYFIRQLVARVRGLKIEVFPREHAPPHFHVKAPGIDATFRVDTGEFINGKIDGRERAIVGWWYERSRHSVVEAWNSTRPSNCQVGLVTS